MKQLLGATIDMNIVVDFIMREMTPEDIRQIPLGKSTLYRLKSSTKEIEKANIKTIYTIQTYALEKKERIKEELALAESEPHSETRTRFIGLDIGTSHLVSASDIDMKDTDRKSTRLNSSHVSISYAVFCLKKKIKNIYILIQHHMSHTQ